MQENSEKIQTYSENQRIHLIQKRKILSFYSVDEYIFLRFVNKISALLLVTIWQKNMKKTRISNIPKILKFCNENAEKLLTNW